MTEFETQQIQLLTEIKNEISSTKQYLSDRDAAAQLAAEQKAVTDAAAAETAAAEKLLKDEADAVILAAEKQADAEFKTELLEKTTNSNDLLTILTEVDYLSNYTFSTDSDSPYLEEIAQNTQVTPFQNEVGSLSYYSDAGVIILVFGVLPIYLAYRFIHPFFGMLNKII